MEFAQLGHEIQQDRHYNSINFCIPDTINAIVSDHVGTKREVGKMKNLIAVQRGMTFLGLVFVLGFIAIVVLFILRAFPLYYERTQVIAAVESVANREGSGKFNDREAQDAFMKAISITNITRFSEKTIKDYLVLEKATERSAPKVLHLRYQAIGPLVADLKLLLDVDISRPLQGASTGG
jgi:hypothetical protein